MAGNKRRSARFVSGVIGTIVVIISIILSIFALNSSSGLPGVPRTIVTMEFTDTGDIHVDGDIREADIRVGRINAVEYRGGGVGTIEAQFDDERPVYNNATAMIVTRSGLGQKYVNINRGTPDAGEMAPGEVIPASRTQSTAEILALADIFDPQTQAAAQSAVEQLGSGLEGNGDALSQAVDAVPINLPRLTTVANALNQNNGDDINLLLTSLRNITARFEGREQQLVDLNRQLATTLDAVNADGGQALANLLQVAPPALAQVRGALDNIDQPLASTRDAVVALRPGVNDLVRAEDDVRGVLREAPQPLDKVPGVSEVGQPALEELTPALADLRPVVPKLRFGLENARVPLQCLATNANDFAFVFTQLGALVRQGDDRGNAARFTIVPSAGSVGLPETAPVTEVPCPRPGPNDKDTPQYPGEQYPGEQPSAEQYPTQPAATSPRGGN